MYDIPIDLKSLEDEIIAYEQEPIVTGKILFYGHSLFTRWKDVPWGNHRLDEDIRGRDGGLACVNHGFGTSTSEELLYFYPRMVRPWAPRALVIMTFSNDGMYGYSPEDVMTNLSKLCHWARTDFPGIKLYLIEAHPHPLKEKPVLPDHWINAFHERDKFNEMISLYAQTHAADTKVIRLWNRPEFFETPADTGNPHKIREELFLEDKVHYNQAGYELFAAILRSELAEVL